MLKRLAVLCVLSFALSTSAVAQNAGDFMNMFGGLMRAAIIEHARAEWSKLSANETECIEQGLQPQGYSIDVMVQNGIAPQDPRVSGIRAGCEARQYRCPPRAKARTTSWTFPRGRPSTAQRQGQPQLEYFALTTRARRQTGTLPLRIGPEVSHSTKRRGRDLRERKRSRIQSLNRTCQLQPWQTSFSPQQRQCVLVAYRRRTELYRSQLKGEAFAESRLSPEQHAQIQSELVRLGFLSAEADGEFGPQTRAAIKSYQAQSGGPQSEFLTADQRNQLLRAAQAPGPSVAQTQCLVSDPTGTLLNIRATPNGDIVGAVNNGVSVRLVQTNQDTRGRFWSLISRVADNQTLGWVYREYVACSPVETPATVRQVGKGNTPAPPASQLALASNSELSMKASKLSSDEAARQCQSSDAETRLIGCTAVIDQKGKGISSTIALADAFDGRCWAYNDLGQYERGLPDCNASIATNPRRYFAYNTLGNSLLGLGDAANAIAAFTKSIELKPEVIYAHLGRARALAASGNLQMARKDYDYVLTIDPANQSAKDGVAELDNPVVPGGPREETANPPARAAQPKETKTLKEARVFLEDAQKFIASQQTVQGCRRL